MTHPFIQIRGARIHNLKNIDVAIPKGKLTVITGVSGSGKSSLAFDTLYEEGKRRYLLFSDTQFMIDAIPMFDRISGLSPTVAVEQRIIRQSNPRSTVGTRTKITNMLAVMYAAYGQIEGGKPLSMEMFLKNSPKGMCVKCLGKGRIEQVDEERLFGNLHVPIEELVFSIAKRGRTKSMMDSFCRVHDVHPHMSLSELTESQRTALLYGDMGRSAFPGFLPWIMEILNCHSSGRLRYLLARDGSVRQDVCPACGGSGLGAQAAQTRLGGKSITELEKMYIRELAFFLRNTDIPGQQLAGEILTKLDCLVNVGLHHLSLSRTVPSLSGGEIQRLFLASYLIADMDSIIFIFDEPTIGLHEVEKASLILTLKNLNARGNTVIAVEHDENFIRAADYIVDLGPQAGIGGGERIFQGGFDAFMTCQRSMTAPYLSGKRRIPPKTTYKPTDTGKQLQVRHARLHNLRDVSVTIPLERMVGVAGVSGSGKSSLITNTLVPRLREMLKTKFVSDSWEEDENESTHSVSAAAVISGAESIKRCVVIDQKPIGRSRTSCPATYTGIYDRIRTLFAQVPEAKELGYSAGMFSVNSEGGCRSCKGDGIVHYHVGYGNFIELACEPCGGAGFREEAMRIKLDGKNIREVLALSVTEAIDFFHEKDKQILNMLQTLDQVGMGYIQLGQKTPTISGGEAQRIKLARELGRARSQSKGHLYILDEPTTGLSFLDVERLLALMQALTDGGNTVIVTEHDPAVLSHCDYIIELGPGGGSEGGYVIAQGSPQSLKENRDSIIGPYLM